MEKLLFSVPNEHSKYENPQSSVTKDMKLELLAPAKNYEQGRMAVDHGADAVYIGASAFGARSAASNEIGDIERLVRYAHLFGCKVFATVNTLLYDNELDTAVQLCHQLYNAGCDALIIQDMGLLECNLPPIELHASTQTHNIEIEHIKFLEQVGFKRVVLAREASLQEISAIREATSIDLEAFIHGALCVSYSGQCYMSQALTDRSGNRGCCSQPCRSSYNLINKAGDVLIHNQHLLSLKDFSARQHIENMINTGITSFKIEGRLKDIEYVKNVTAYYRLLIDNIIAQSDGLTRASSGKIDLHFVPDIEKTFNRGFTDYFLERRKPMASFMTQKSIGKRVGRVVQKLKEKIVIDPDSPDTAFCRGDGLCYFNHRQELKGFSINDVNGYTVTPNKVLDIPVGAPLWRNRDQVFEKELAGESATRKIAVDMTFSSDNDNLHLMLTDEDNCRGEAHIAWPKQKAVQKELALEHIRNQLSKMGGTPFYVRQISCQLQDIPFIPAAPLNELRRNAISDLETSRIKKFTPQPDNNLNNAGTYYKTDIDYRGNVLNTRALTFYKKHGVNVREWGLEKEHHYEGKALMTTRYCLRYELKQCLKHLCNTTIDPAYSSQLYLENNGKRFRLHFDCRHCQMQLFLDGSIAHP